MNFLQFLKLFIFNPKYFLRNYIKDKSNPPFIIIVSLIYGLSLISEAITFYLNTKNLKYTIGIFTFSLIIRLLFLPKYIKFIASCSNGKIQLKAILYLIFYSAFILNILIIIDNIIYIKSAFIEVPMAILQLVFSLHSIYFLFLGLKILGETNLIRFILIFIVITALIILIFSPILIPFFDIFKTYIFKTI